MGREVGENEVKEVREILEIPERLPPAVPEYVTEAVEEWKVFNNVSVSLSNARACYENLVVYLTDLIGDDDGA